MKPHHRLALIMSLAAIVSACKPPATSPTQQTEITELRKEVAELRAQRQADEDRAKQAQKSELSAQMTEKQAQMTEGQKKSEAAVQRVLKQLLKLKAITEAGVDYKQYADRLIDAKGEVDADLLQVDNVGFRQDVTIILNAYIDARDFWSRFMGSTSIDYFNFTVEDRRRFYKYNCNQVARFWAWAQEHLADTTQKYPELVQFKERFPDKTALVLYHGDLIPYEAVRVLKDSADLREKFTNRQYQLDVVFQSEGDKLRKIAESMDRLAAENKKIR